MAVCTLCNQEMNDEVGCTQTHYADLGPVPLARLPHPVNSHYKCRDCKVPPGTFHHADCVMERCPKCNGQAVDCSCVLELEPDEDADNEDAGEPTFIMTEPDSFLPPARYFDGDNISGAGWPEQDNA